MLTVLITLWETVSVLMYSVQKLHRVSVILTIITCLNIAMLLTIIKIEEHHNECRIKY